MKNKEVINHIVNWLKNYAQDNNMNGFVVGVSWAKPVSSIIFSIIERSNLEVELRLMQATIHYM